MIVKKKMVRRNLLLFLIWKIDVYLSKNKLSTTMDTVFLNSHWVIATAGIYLRVDTTSFFKGTRSCFCRYADNHQGQHGGDKRNNSVLHPCIFIWFLVMKSELMGRYIKKEVRLCIYTFFLALSF